jgi:glutathione S-transferase
VKELAYFESVLHGDYLAGEFSAADLCLYPLLALLGRI